MKHYTNECRRLTHYPPISLEDLLHVDLVDLEGVEVADEDPGVDRVRVLRAGLVSNLAQIHGGGGILKERF